MMNLMKHDRIVEFIGIHHATNVFARSGNEDLLDRYGVIATWDSTELHKRNEEQYRFLGRPCADHV
jgi:hypothetical protein